MSGFVAFRVTFNVIVIAIVIVITFYSPSCLGQETTCGVKELIMFIACANAAITQTMYQMIYPSESNSERFDLFLCHVFAIYQRCSISASLSDSDSQTNGFLSFLSVSTRAQVSFFFCQILTSLGQKRQRWNLYIKLVSGAASHSIV